jgi:hypothetical protein
MKSRAGKVRNPETGKLVAVGGTHYKRLVKKGVVERPGELPPIERFVYLPDQDIWIRGTGTRYDGYLAHGYLHVKERRMLVRRGVCNTLSEEELKGRSTTVLEGDVAHRVLDVADVVALILEHACTTPGMYARLRMTCQAFREVVDTAIRVEPLVRLANGQKTRHGVELHLYRHLDTMPYKVCREYARLFPDELVAGMRTLVACKPYTRLVKEGGSLGDALKAASVRWLHALPEAALGSRVTYWSQLKTVLLAVEVPEELLERMIGVYIQSRRSIFRILPLKAYQEQAHSKRPVWPAAPIRVVPALPPGVEEEEVVAGEEEVAVGEPLVENAALDEQIVAALHLEEVD